MPQAVPKRRSELWEIILLFIYPAKTCLLLQQTCGWLPGLQPLGVPSVKNLLGKPYDLFPERLVQWSFPSVDAEPQKDLGASLSCCHIGFC